MVDFSGPFHLDCKNTRFWLSYEVVDFGGPLVDFGSPSGRF